MRAFSRVPVARALPASTTLTSRALYTTYRASVPALGPLESRRGRVENAGINDPALNPLKEAASEKADQAKNAFKSAAHAAGADDALHRASDAASGMGEKIKKAAHDMEDKAMAPEVRKYPVEFSMATGGAVVGLGLMLWWMYMYMRPQHSIENETARTGGQGVEDAKKIVESQKASTKKMV